MSKIGKFIGEEIVFVIVLLLTILSSLFLKRIPEITYADFRVLVILFSFLLITKGLEKSDSVRYFV